ncbi:hypothetical protein Acr_00g0103150 [Actinidia rufa]|uniref:Uncharacterized protein n=1 Tax=Actinidia rufa TaxID=165716 RepID=A0A7J0E0W3_9ERIC|nr:hypothetical protein Acr_00g0103150 [Actinidia rufa]
MDKCGGFCHGLMPLMKLLWLFAVNVAGHGLMPLMKLLWLVDADADADAAGANSVADKNWELLLIEGPFAGCLA